MKEHLTPHDIANTARMMRSQRPGTFLIVEGDTDARVYGRFTDGDRCTVLVAHGKDNALITLDMLEKSAFPGALAIVDSDFWRLDGVTPGSVNVLVTDTHDLETMILSSSALDEVLLEFGRKDRLDRLPKPVRDIILDACLPIGYFRWLSTSPQENLLLNFSDIAFTAVVSVKDSVLWTDIDALIGEVRAGSHGTMPPKRDLRARILRLLRGNRHDPWQVCVGHDLVHIFAIGLRDLFGGRSARSITSEAVDRILRIAYTIEEFSETELYRAIREWEKKNGYGVMM